VHEIGHQHGRGHAPCGATDGLDGKYPYTNAFTGAWGFDYRLLTLESPLKAHDMMSYCEPWWISDYTYSAIADRRQAIAQNGAGARVVDLGGKSQLPSFRGFRSLLTGLDDGKLVWGGALPADQIPDGTPEIAKALDAAGQVVAEVTVYRSKLGHASGTVSSFDVPQPQPGWAALQLAGEKPIRFSDPIGVPALQPMNLKGIDGGNDPLRTP
jgi:hypothetical protein